MSEIPPNGPQARATAPKEHIKPVTSATAERRKRGLGRQFKETFFSGTGRDALGYMVEEVVVPAIRDTLHDAMQSGIERLIYGGDHRTRSRSYSAPWANPNANGPRVDYTAASKPTRASQPTGISRRGRARNDFGEILIPSGPEAHEVIDRMFEILQQYGQVSVGDLLALVGIRADHTDEKWGWSNLQGATAVRQRNGMFRLALPEPEELYR